MPMTLRQRMSIVGRALVGLFSDESLRQAHGLLAGIYPGAAGTPPLRGTQERLGAFATMPWLHAAADKVAHAFAATEWQLYVARRAGGRARMVPAVQKAGWTGERREQDRKTLLARLKADGELDQIETHPMLDILNRANAFHTGLDLRRLMALHYDLAGDVFLLKERDGLRTPTGLWPLPAHWIARTPTPTQRTYRVAFRGWHGEIPDTEILWITNPNPEFPYGRGVGIAGALADELETDEYAAKTTRQRFFNQAQPDFLIWPKGEAGISRAEVLRLQEEWLAEHQGFWRVAKPKFLTREVAVHEFESSVNFRSLQFVQLREFERDCVRQVWGIPPEIMGIVEPGTARATITVASYIFARWVLVPRLEAFRAHFQERLAPEYDERLIVDYSSPIDEDSDRQLQAATAASWALTVDEWRQLVGLPKKEDGSGEVHMIPFNLTPSALTGGSTGPGAEMAEFRRALLG